jgi:hypothetical protein
MKRADSLSRNSKLNMVFIVVLIFGILGSIALIISNAADTSTIQSTTSSAISTPTASFSVVASGDVGKSGDKTRQQRTADLIKRINPTYVLALGDLAYESGTSAEFAANYAPYWGVPEILNITKPIPGNHEYNTVGATGYFNYFDSTNTGKFGARDKGYYSFTKDNWLFLNINSECSKIGGCRNDSVQAKWVDQQLADNPDKCVVASWHRPRVTSGRHTDYLEVNDIWNKIVARKGIVLTGHNHIYSRSVPLGANAVPDAGGILQFVSGAGGAPFYTDISIDGRDAKRIDDSLGVLKLTLSGNNVDYKFIDVNDNVLDQGTQTLGCPNPATQTTKTGDLNSDNKVDVLDLSVLLSGWDPTGSKPKNAADINNDNKVDVLDLSALLSNWGNLS